MALNETEISRLKSTIVNHMGVNSILDLAQYLLEHVYDMQEEGLRANQVRTAISQSRKYLSQAEEHFNSQE